MSKVQRKVAVDLKLKSPKLRKRKCDVSTTIENTEKISKSPKTRKRKCDDFNSNSTASISKSPKTRKRKCDNFTSSVETSNAKRQKKGIVSVNEDDSVDLTDKEIFQDLKRPWTDTQWLADNSQIDSHVAHRLLVLFENDNSIPFIARYRRDLTDNMTPDQLRLVKETYDNLKILKKKTQLILKNLQSQGKLDQHLQEAISSARSLDEVEHLYAPYKPGNKKLLSERAKELGLEDAALAILNGTKPISVENVAKEKELSEEQVQSGITHIIAFTIYHDTKCLEYVRKLRDTARDIQLECKAVKAAEKASAKATEQKIVSEKFSNYFNFKLNIQYLKPHQVLAINRGESLKALLVKLIIPERIYKSYRSFCMSAWAQKGMWSPTRTSVLDLSINDAYTRYIQPLLVRQIRNDLKEQAEKSSVNVFENNLKNMLLLKPCKGERILGLDPGFKHGCKYALISETSDVLTTGALHPNFNSNNVKHSSSFELKSILESYQCSIIALGNGTACRETESWISDLKQAGILRESVKYAIVNESGASIYSCTPEAKTEFPNFDVNVISAVSIARRLQDPLSELIKIEPKHLGVGMYQHDLKEKQLNESLEEVISECVSFVGVNLNTSSECLLRRIAGLNKTRASNIIDYRHKIGFFQDRQQLKKVKGIGDKVFEQCAGFLRVAPATKQDENQFYKSKKANYLDRTWIHPESYELASKVLKKCNVELKEIGTEISIEKVNNFQKQLQKSVLVTELNTSENVLDLIFEAFSKPIDHDLRLESTQQALFKTGLTNIHDMCEGTVLTGRVQNVTEFGSFIDIGVGVNGLIHRSKTKGLQLQLGDHVETKVLEVDIPRKRIGLVLISVLTS